MNFRNFQTTFDPPQFRKLILHIFSLYKGPKLALYILRMEMTPPPLELFRIFIRFGIATRPLLENFPEFPPSIE